MKASILMFCLFAASPALAGDIHLEEIDITRIQKALPEKWYVSEVLDGSKPDGWNQTEGDRGIRITVSREPYSYELKYRGKPPGLLSVWQPKFFIAIMPGNFVGISAQGDTFRNGKIMPPPGPRPNPACEILGYAGSMDDAHIFISKGSFSDWKDPGQLVMQIQKKGKP